jgi:hypothetical protein
MGGTLQVHHDNLPTPGNVVHIRGCDTEADAETKAVEALEICHSLSEQGVSGPRLVSELQRRGLCHIQASVSASEQAVCMQSMD